MTLYDILIPLRCVVLGVVKGHKGSWDITVEKHKCRHHGHKFLETQHNLVVYPGNATQPLLLQFQVNLESEE